MTQDAFFTAALADHTNDVILVTNADAVDAPDGPNIVYCNAAFERASGWTRAEAMGRTPRILQCKDTDRRELDRLKAALRRWRAGGESEPTRAELLNVTKAGALFWVDLSITPIWDDAARRPYWAAIQRDVTDRVKREAAVRKALRREDSARADRDELLAKISHDMRTPLNAIAGYSELLQSGHAGPLSIKQASYVSDIGRAADQLSGLVRDLLDANALSRGALAVHAEAMRAHELVDYGVSMARASAEKRGVSVRVKGSTGAPIFADAIRARQCITNVLDNAIKFSPVGGAIVIDVSSLDDRTAIAVSDDGPGMTDGEIETALSLFGQVEPGVRSAAEGVGLGLPITLRLMRLQGGDLHVLSQSGVGSTFTLVFPQARRRDPNPPA